MYNAEILQMIAAFSLYFSFLFSIGFYFYTSTKTESDFALGGRKINYWLTAISAQASDMSDWLFMGFPGVVYASGLCEIWMAIGLSFFMWATWHFIAPGMRKLSEHHNSLTLSSFLNMRFNSPNNHIRIISGLICLYFFTFYIAAGLIGLGKVFSAAFGIKYHIGIIIGLCITLMYTSLGGLLAIAWSDLFQGTFLLGAILGVPLYVIFYMLGGPISFMQQLSTLPASYLSIIPSSGYTSLFGTILSIMAWGIGYFGQPHILVNFMSIDDPEKIKKAKIVGLSWQILAVLGAILTGIVGKIFIANLGIEGREMVFINMVKTIFSPFFAGIILCAVLSATISTINIQTLISASLLSHDLFGSLYKVKNESAKLLFQRASIIIIPLLSLSIAWDEHYYVLDTVYYAWAGLGSAFGPLVILAIYARNISHHAALGGLITGAGIAMIWPMLGIKIPTLVAGFTGNFIVTLCLQTFLQKKIHSTKK